MPGSVAGKCDKDGTHGETICEPCKCDCVTPEDSAQYKGSLGLTKIAPAGILDKVENTGMTDYIPPPVADFVGYPTSGNAPLTVDFTDQSTGSITSWSWDFGKFEGTSDEQNPTHEYKTEGFYTVTLTVTGPGGKDTETKTNYIIVGFTGE